MPPESEVIKQQMGQTRAALTEKLETLENQVVGTVRDTTSTVQNTVHDVGATVRDTMHDVRASVRETLDTVKDTFDIPRQVEQHPWLMLGSSIVAGYVGGSILESLERGGRLPPRGPVPAGPEELLTERVLTERETEPPTPSRGMPSFLRSLADTFAPELAKLKGVALGVTLGLVRDKISESIPSQMKGDVNDIIDRVTVKLGGEPTPPGSISLHGDGPAEHNGSERARSMGVG